MLEFLIVLDVLLAVAIISAVFFHKGPDGFMGDATPTNANTNGPKFEAFDKIIAGFVVAFFAVTLSINYIYLYKDQGTAKIDDIISGTATIRADQEQQEKKDAVGAEAEAPIIE